MKYIRRREETYMPERPETLFFFNRQTGTLFENRGASETAKIIQLIPVRRDVSR